MCHRETKRGRRVVSRSFKAYVKYARLRFASLRSALHDTVESRIRLLRAQPATRTGKAENYPSKPLSIVLSPYLTTSTPFPLLSSHRYPPSLLLLFRL